MAVQSSVEVEDIGWVEDGGRVGLRNIFHFSCSVSTRIRVAIQRSNTPASNWSCFRIVLLSILHKHFVS